MFLPTPIQTYFTAESPLDDAVFRAAFALDARVHDEGATHCGPDEIVAWWKAAKARYRHLAEPLDLVEAASKHRVRARVSGDFPGSPAVLTFAFDLTGDHIRDLKIG